VSTFVWCALRVQGFTCENKYGFVINCTLATNPSHVRRQYCLVNSNSNKLAKPTSPTPKHPNQNNPCQTHSSLSKHTTLHSAIRIRFSHCLPLLICRVKPCPPLPSPTYTPFHYHQRKFENESGFVSIYTLATHASHVTRQWCLVNIDCNSVRVT
jgi:hypothetical protein